MSPDGLKSGVNIRTIVLLLCSVILRFPCSSAEPDSLQQAPARPSRAIVEALGDTAVVRIRSDSLKSGSAADTSLNTYTILVDPPEATHASVRVIQTALAEYQTNSLTTYPIAPDTLGQWTVPLKIALFPGEYTLVMERTGYRKGSRALTAGESLGRAVSVRMELLSFAYLQAKQRQWSTTKWISAGVCVLATAATVYVDHNITGLANDYSMATNPDGARDLRSQIGRKQDLFRIVSAIAWTSLGSTLLSWFIELTYH